MLELKAGDLFLVNNPTWFGKLINHVQSWSCKQDKAVYDHSGIIVNTTSTTLESRWTVCQNNLFEFYKGRQILIVRCKKLSNTSLNAGLDEVFSHKGEWYPVSRLFLDIFHLAKIIHWNHVVCSELVAKFLFVAGIRDYHWFGTTPEDLEDEFKHWRSYSVIFEGIL